MMLPSPASMKTAPEGAGQSGALPTQVMTPSIATTRP